MDRLRRSFRDSFRKKKETGLEASKPHQWQHDETAVRAATCAFPVKYLGCVEVFESRGMQVCEEALKVLRASRRRPIRGMLHVSGDGLRVVDDETKGLLVDQTIEKVSFCAPDRNHERGFSYICRDGTTRRWMCHGFVAIKETGERLSHAVGCAFAACLDRKQKRDKECGVTMTFDQANNTFTRMGSFKQMSITDRLTDPQVCKPNSNNDVTSPTAGSNKAPNPHAIARPHATPLMLQRQGSCRVFHHLNQSSPFKRQLSLRLNDLPSNMERQRSHSLTSANIFDNIPDNTNSENGSSDNGGGVDNAGSVGGMNFPSDAYNNNGAAYGGAQAGPFPRSKTTTSIIMSSIPEDSGDTVSALCQELWQGLSLLSSDTPADTFGTTTHPAAAPKTGAASHFTGANRPVSPKIGGTILVPSVEPIREEVPWSTPTPTSGTQAPSLVSTATTNSGGGVSKAEEWLAQLNAGTVPPVNGTTSPIGGPGGAAQRRNPPLSQLRANTMGTANPIHQPQTQPPVWKPTVPVPPFSAAPPSQHPMPAPSTAGVPGMPLMSGARQSTNFSTTLPSLAAQGVVGGVRRDPFDSEWISLDNGDGTRSQQQPPPILPTPPLVNPNNPFLPASTVTKAFEVQM